MLGIECFSFGMYLYQTIHFYHLRPLRNNKEQHLRFMAGNRIMIDNLFLDHKNVSFLFQNFLWSVEMFPMNQFAPQTSSS